MKKAIVTGANGFIGSNLIKRLLQEKIAIYAFILESETPKDFLVNNPLVKIIKCDLENINFQEIKLPQDIDVFYHLAWIGVRPEDRKKFDVQIRNIRMTLNCLKLAAERKVKRFVMPGSTNEYLYSGALINAKTLPTPQNDYGSVKVALRYLAQQYAKDNGIEFIYAVITGIYSEQRNDNNVISYTIKTLLNGCVPHLSKCEQLWDYVYIDDAIEALYLIGEKGRSDALYAVGHGDNWPLINYINIIHEKINPSLPLGIGDVPYSSESLPMSCVDMEDLERDTGFEPKVSFEDGISRVIKQMEKKTHSF